MSNFAWFPIFTQIFLVRLVVNISLISYPVSFKLNYLGSFHNFEVFLKSLMQTQSEQVRKKLYV